MTPEENYQSFLDSIFNVDTIKIPLNSNHNNIIGAISHPENYDSFINNFKNRLIKLKDLYKDSHSYQTLLTTIKQVADDKNWNGAYAELTALDILNIPSLVEGIELDITLPGKESFAIEWGKHETNEDGKWNDYDAFFDVKILSDPVEAVLKSIVTTALRNTNNLGKCSVLFGYKKDDEETLYIQNFHKIIKELSNGLNSNIEHVHSSIIPELCFNIKWGYGINSATSTYNPYRHAENTKDLILKRYTYKFLKKKPFFIVFVNFPWFDQVVNDFSGMNKVYYRALARRTFFQYIHSNKKMSHISNKYKGNKYARTITKYLSGIIFIDDDSIKSNNHSCYVYLNPNRKNKRPIMEKYLQSIANSYNDGIYDDFEYDNY